MESDKGANSSAGRSTETLHELISAKIEMCVLEVRASSIIATEEEIRRAALKIRDGKELIEIGSSIEVLNGHFVFTDGSVYETHVG